MLYNRRMINMLNMKKITVLLLIVLMIFSFNACSSESGTKQAKASETKEETEEEKDSTSQSKSKKSTSTETEEEENKAKPYTSDIDQLILMDTAKYSFGSIAINAFKRGDTTFYYSWTIVPTTSEKIEIKFKNFYTIVSGENLQTNNDGVAMTVEGKNKSELMMVSDIDPKTVTGIGFNYDGKETQWLFGTGTQEGGDQTFIDQQIYNMENQANAQQEAPQAEVSAEEQNAITYGYAAVEEYGRQLYPYGFYINNQEEEVSRTNLGNGHWILQARCYITDMYGNHVSSLFEAEVAGSGNQWSVANFHLLDI